jgi:hypothetical protein
MRVLWSGLKENKLKERQNDYRSSGVISDGLLPPRARAAAAFLAL